MWWLESNSINILFHFTSRFLKKYNLNYHTLPDNDEVVPGHTVSMSSYTGTILSLDDFVTVSSGLVTTETTLNIYNTSLYNHCNPSRQLFEPVRSENVNNVFLILYASFATLSIGWWWQTDCPGLAVSGHPLCPGTTVAPTTTSGWWSTWTSSLPW